MHTYILSWESISYIYRIDEFKNVRVDVYKFVENFICYIAAKFDE